MEPRAITIGHDCPKCREAFGMIADTKEAMAIENGGIGETWCADCGYTATYTVDDDEYYLNQQG